MYHIQENLPHPHLRKHVCFYRLFYTSHDKCDVDLLINCLLDLSFQLLFLTSLREWCHILILSNSVVVFFSNSLCKLIQIFLKKNSLGKN